MTPEKQAAMRVYKTPEQQATEFIQQYAPAETYDGQMYPLYLVCDDMVERTFNCKFVSGQWYVKEVNDLRVKI